MDEKVKHRVVGLAVILSIGTIIAPAVIKKSGQRFERRPATTFNMPKRPLYPEVTVKGEDEVFKAAKVAHVSLEKTVTHDKKPVMIAKAKPISSLPQTSLPNVPIQQKKPTIKLSSTHYAVQLASFSRQKNANELVSQLARKGFSAHFEKETNSAGRVIYKVMVGDESRREEAIELKQALVQRIKLKGIVVSQRVS